MNHFKEPYQKQVINNARAFALALKDCGLDIAGDADVSYTETHQVIVNVGYTKGPEVAQRLEEYSVRKSILPALKASNMTEMSR